MYSLSSNSVKFFVSYYCLVLAAQQYQARVALRALAHFIVLETISTHAVDTTAGEIVQLPYLVRPSTVGGAVYRTERVLQRCNLQQESAHILVDLIESKYCSARLQC